MLLLDADRAGMRGHVDELLQALPRYTLSNQLNILVRLGARGHARFGDALDLVLHEAALDDIPAELFDRLGSSVLQHAPDRLGKLYDRLLALPVPEDGRERRSYVLAINNACVQAHTAKDFETAVRIADRAQAVAHENPFIYHSAACAYAAVGAYEKALEQVKLAIAHDYEHLDKLQRDSDLGELLAWPQFKALFR
jgi:tetratricopeptide (TPR) repeat protein